eukprot:2852376-Amphidinium_carterae.1
MRVRQTVGHHGGQWSFPQTICDSSLGLVENPSPWLCSRRKSLALVDLEGAFFARESGFRLLGAHA